MWHKGLMKGYRVGSPMIYQIFGAWLTRSEAQNVLVLLASWRVFKQKNPEARLIMHPLDDKRPIRPMDEC